MSFNFSNPINQACLVILFFLPQLGHSQNSEFTREQIREDIEFMFSRMEDTHPNLYYFTSRETIQNRKESLLSEITGPIGRKEFYIAFMPLVVSLNDGHTSMGFPEQEIARYIQYGGKFFPVNVYIRDDQLYVKSSQHDTIPAGALILSINGKKATDIIVEMRNYLSGEKVMYRNTKLQFRFAGFYWLLFQEKPVFTIQYQLDNMKQHKVELEGIREAELRQLSKDSGKKKSLFEYRKLDKTTGLIDFRSFSEMDEFKEFLEGTFTQIKETGIENLVIDIRENGGGNSSLGDELFSYITDEPYSMVDKMLVKMSEDVIKSGWGSWLDKDTLEYYRGKVYTSPKHMEKPGINGLRFHGEVYLLTGPNSFSSANMFASAFKCYKMGTIIGEETGGLTVSYGDVRSFLLPNTQLRCGCSFKQFYEACGRQDGHGVIPDHEVKSNPAGTTDTVLEYTLDLINKKKK